MTVLIVSALVALLDQLAKQAVRARFHIGESLPVFDGWFHLTYVRNTGAAWGMFSGQNIGLIVLSVVMLVLVVAFRRSFLKPSLEHRLALGLMIGGILGNLYDRVRYGWVVDYLDVFWKDWHWPAFNIADAAICIGVGLYMISSFWMAGHPLREPNGRGVKDAAPPSTAP